jgi:hypothetical protein
MRTCSLQLHVSQLTQSLLQLPAAAQRSSGLLRRCYYCQQNCSAVLLLLLLLLPATRHHKLCLFAASGTHSFAAAPALTSRIKHTCSTPL